MRNYKESFYHGERTICQVLREVLQICKNDTGSPEYQQIAKLAFEAGNMAKSMDKKLRYYKLDWDAFFWKKEKADFFLPAPNDVPDDGK